MKCCKGIYRFIHKPDSPIKLPKGYMGVEVCTECGKVIRKVKTTYFNDGNIGNYNNNDVPRIRSKRFCDIIR